MKIPKQIYFVLAFIFSFFLSVLISSKIHIPLGHTSIVGEYSEQNYHPLNDFLKYITYILVPILFFFLLKLIFDKKIINNFFQNFNDPIIIFKFDRSGYFLAFFFIVLIIFEFLSVEYPMNKMDLYHEGQRLSAAFKNALDGSLWSGSYVVVSIFHEIVGTKMIWSITGNKTIGSLRFLDLSYVLITKIFLIFLSFQLSKFVNLSNNLKNIFFVVITFILLQQIDYNIYDGGVLALREIPVILTLIFFFKSLESKSYINFLIIGFILVSTFFWSIDRALVLSFFSIYIFIFLLLSKRYFQIYVFFISILLFSIVFSFILGFELNYFFNNTINVFKEHTYVNGIIHPDLLTDEKNSFRATKSVALIILSLLIALNLFFNKKHNKQNNLKIVLLSLSVISFLSYIYAIGRSDGPHIKQTLGFPIIFFTLFFLNIFFEKLRETSLNKYLTNRLYPIGIFILISLINYQNFNLTNSINFFDRYTKYVSLTDDKFLKNEDFTFIKLHSKIFDNETCLQLFTNDAALNFLFKKPSCSRFYFTYTIGSKINQKKIISEIKDTNYILIGGETDNWSLPFKKKYPLLFEHIKNNYSIFKEFSKRKILVKN